MRKLLPLLSCIVCLPALATEWKTVGRTEGAATIEIDSESVRPRGTATIAWQRIVHQHPQPLADGNHYSVRQNLIEVECERRAIRIERTIFLDARGAIVGLEDGTARARVVRPDAVGNDIVRFICRR